MLKCYEKKSDPAINLLQAIDFSVTAWWKVTARCISSCFRKAGFSVQNRDDSDEDSDPEDDIPLGTLAETWTAVQEADPPVDDVSLHDFLHPDTEVAVAETPTDDDIVATILQTEDEEDSDDSDADTPVTLSTPVPTPMKTTQMRESFENIRRFITKHSGVDSEQLHISTGELEDRLLALKQKKPKAIVDFFNG